jgi:hypothetical protein
MQAEARLSAFARAGCVQYDRREAAPHDIPSLASYQIELETSVEQSEGALDVRFSAGFD